MAWVEHEVKIANPAKRKGGKRNVARMTQKQKLHFGTKAQRAAARRAMRAKRNPPKKRRNSSPRSHRARTNPKRKRNPDLISVTLPLAAAANPAKRGKKSMARPKRRRKSNAARRSAGRHVARKANPGRRHHVKRHRSRRNPGMGKMGGMVETGVGVIAGGVGSKLLAQMVLGSSNTGPIGYAANAVAGGVLAGAAHMFKLPKGVVGGIGIGTVVQILLRVIGDYSLLGKYSSQLGLGRMIGDYQIANFVAPQRLIDAQRGYNVEIPRGWAPTVVQPAAVSQAGGMSGWGAMDGAGRC